VSRCIAISLPDKRFSPLLFRFIGGTAERDFERALDDTTRLNTFSLSQHPVGEVVCLL